MTWNGYNVVSTFSGGGGSCLGYRMAGYRVAWANEFIPAAQETYKANSQDTFLNCGNIRDVTPEQVVAESGIPIGEIDLFDGSPPCAAFSTAGKRAKYWGKKKKYSDTTERVDDLFFEYARLVRALQPKTFVAENVSGLVKGIARAYFRQFVSELAACGYNVRVRLLNAKHYGVPQSRERVIFVGVRNDLCERFGVAPAFPEPDAAVVSLSAAFHGLQNDEAERLALLDEAKKYAWTKIARRMGLNPKKSTKGADVTNGTSYFMLRRDSIYGPCSTICQTQGNPSAAGCIHPLEDRKYTIAELKRITTIPDDFVLTGNYQQKTERLGRMVPPLMMRRIAATIKTEILDKIKERS